MAKILVVEDHALSRQMLTTLLGYVGHQVIEASDGVAALDLARNECPDLVICDVLVPIINGIQLVRLLRDEAVLSETPVLFYTAISRLPENLDLGESLSTCRVIAKPAAPQIIVQAVDEMLGYAGKGATEVAAGMGEVAAAAHPAGSLGQAVRIGQPLAAGPSAQPALQVAVLLDLVSSLVGQRDSTRLLSDVARTMQEIVSCRRSLLAVKEGDGATRYYQGRAGEEPLLFMQTELLPPPEVLERITTGRTAIRLQQTLAMPFASPGYVHGWVYLADRLDGAGFSEVDEEMATMLSAQAALAYENISLVQRLRDNEEYLEQLVAQRTAELRRANLELLKIEKLQSLGVLAGGIAHDFNNALTVINTHIQIARLKTAPEDRSYRNLVLAEKACRTAKSLTMQLLTFAKGGSPVKEAAKLDDLIWETAEFALRGSSARCEFVVAPDLQVVEVDPGQISQVIGNLVINAGQAMPEGGIVKVLASNVLLEAGQIPPLRAGRYVRLSVADEGVGIPAEHLDRIFDPYFTTKAAGSGLGLAMALSIVRNHEGYITAESEGEGAGSTFHVYLPASDAKSAAEQSTQPQPRLTQMGNGRVLLIEDEAGIVETVSELLEMYGYKVDWALDGNAGIGLYERAMEKGTPFDAVIMDLTIPGGMGGTETIKRLREIDPAVAAIVSSGYSNAPVMANYAEYGFGGAVCKPYAAETMLRELERVLDRRGTANM